MGHEPLSDSPARSPIELSPSFCWRQRQRYNKVCAAVPPGGIWLFMSRRLAQHEAEDKSEGSSSVLRATRCGCSFELCSVAFGTSSPSYEFIYTVDDNSEDSIAAPRNARPVITAEWFISKEDANRFPANTTHGVRITALGSSRCVNSKRSADSFRRTMGGITARSARTPSVTLTATFGETTPVLPLLPESNQAVAVSFKANRYKSFLAYVSKAKEMRGRD